MRDKYLGKTFVNKEGREAVVVGFPKFSNTHVIARFLESGYSDVFEVGNLVKGNFKDYGVPTVYGVGYSYKGAKKNNLKVYKSWSHMLERCYSKRFSAYKWYGGKGVKVHEDWLHFRKFENDIKKLKNYDKFLVDPFEYTLDKDIIGDGMLYSKDTCVFASRKEQVYAQKRMRPIKSFSEDGEVKVFSSIREACKELKVQNANVYKVLNGTRKHTCGYRFERISPTE
ncbi:hypothetical protein [Sediminibacillus massiliensis]|uniref:hypothetical protein n=1 Tax=Sediminibacillus massiliensis TaxID=1926277 RepID=UPI000988520D|nr:hypothetical protein [Sediminibacillus massiliensis]